MFKTDKRKYVDENHLLSCVRLKNRETENFKYELRAKKRIRILYGDRFIPRRRTAINNEKNLKYFDKGIPRDIFILRPNYWRQHKLAVKFKTVMNLKTERILQITDQKLLLQSTELYVSKSSTFDWPCIPRPRPFVCEELTYGITNSAIIAEEAVTDWSIDGQIAVTNGIDVIIYRTKENITKEIKMKFPKCLSYSPTGQYLAISCGTTNHPLLEIWHVQSQKFTIVHRKTFKSEHTLIQCIEWDDIESKIICGTSLGTIFVLNLENLSTVYKLQRHSKPITKVRLSPTMRYLVSGYIDGIILIHKWPNIEEYRFVETNCTTSTVFDWHPWTGEDLIIAEQNPPSIMIYNARLKALGGYYKKRIQHMNIDSVSFSKLTGELIVSISKEESTYRNYEVLVLSSLDCVVDVLRTSNGRTKFLTWSPDGTCVATTCNIDNATLTIWNFCDQTSLKSATQQKLLTTTQTKINNDQQQKRQQQQYGYEFNKWNNMR